MRAALFTFLAVLQLCSALPPELLPARSEEDRVKNPEQQLLLNPRLKDVVPPPTSTGTVANSETAPNIQIPKGDKSTTIFGDNVNLKWLSWNGSLPNGAVAIYNGWAKFSCSYFRRKQKVGESQQQQLGKSSREFQTITTPPAASMTRSNMLGNPGGRPETEAAGSPGCGGDSAAERRVRFWFPWSSSQSGIDDRLRLQVRQLEPERRTRTVSLGGRSRAEGSPRFSTAGRSHSVSTQPRSSTCRPLVTFPQPLLSAGPLGGSKRYSRHILRRLP
ncbi:natterin-4-like [Arapaima gigas]